MHTYMLNESLLALACQTDACNEFFSCTSPTFDYPNWRLVHVCTLRAAAQTHLQWQRTVVSFTPKDFCPPLIRLRHAVDECTACPFHPGTIIWKPERILALRAGKGMIQDVPADWKRTGTRISALPTLSRQGIVTSGRKDSASAMSSVHLSHRWRRSPMLASVLSKDPRVKSP